MAITPMNQNGGLLGSMLGGGGGAASGPIAEPRLGLLGGEEGDFRDTLRKLGTVMMMMDPMSQRAGTAMMALQGDRAQKRTEAKQKNATAAWLGTQGVGQGEASFLASDPNALNAWYSAWKTGQKPDWHIEEINTPQGKQKVMIDYKSGQYNPLGSVDPGLKMESVFDDNGQETKVLMDPNGNIVKKIGGSKTDVISPEAEEQKVRIAGASRPVTNINTKGETKYSETVMGEKGYGGTYNELQAAGRKAPGARATIGLMRKAMEDPEFESGGASEYGLKAKQWANSLGFETGSTSAMEIFNGLSKKMTLDAMNGSLGTGISNADRDFIVGQVPNLGISAGGNKALLEVQDKLQSRAPVIAKKARDYAAAHDGHIDAGFDDELAAWGEANPLFTPQDLDRLAKMGAEPAKPKGKAAPAAPAKPDAEGWTTTPNGVRIREKPGGG